MKYDVVVVGSGVGGLYAALVLAKEGKRVVVLERHTLPGGLLQCFSRKGVVFPTGVHYIGALDKGQITRRYFEYVGIMDRVGLESLDRDGFDEYRFPDFSIRLPCGHDAFVQRLCEHFPAEEPAIRCFTRDMRDTCGRHALYNMRPIEEGERRPEDQECFAGYLDRLTDDEQLKRVLTVNNSLYGVPPGESPRFVSFLVLDSFLQSAHRISNGSGRLAEACVDRLIELGGQVRTRANVVEITCNNDGVRGVKLENGESIEADTVVFSGHPKNFLRLTRDCSFRPAYRTRIEGLEETMGQFGVCLVKRDGETELSSRNVFLFSGKDTSAHYGQRLTREGEQPRLVFCSGSPGTGGATPIVLLSAVDYEEVAAWENSSTGRRPTEYREFKASLGHKIMEFASSRLPELGTEVEVASLFSPLTFRDYVAAWRGSAYGVKRSLTQIRSSRISTRTKVKGLFLAGQNVELPGVVGTIIGSVACCASILGSKYLVRKMDKATA